MKTAVYPGSFDPITNGHYDIIIRASQLFDKVIVLVAKNPSKSMLFSDIERVNLLKEIVKDIPNVEVESDSGLLVEYVKKIKARYVIRGLRAVSDFQYEFEMALANRSMSDKTVDTVFFMTDEQYFYLSSSFVKQVIKLGGSLEDKVHPIVHAALKKKYSNGTQ